MHRGSRGLSTRLRWTGAAAAVLAVVLTTGIALAADGDLDSGFSGDGKLVTSIATANFQEAKAALQPDGKLVAVTKSSGDLAIARFNADGTPDTTFNAPTGSIVVPVAAPAGEDAAGIKVLPDGKIIVAATWNQSGGNESDLLLIRLTDAGIVDTTFDGQAGAGDGEDGVLRVNLGPGATTDTAGALQADGASLLVAGSYDDDGPAATQFAGPMVAKFNSQGQLDTSFGGGDGFAFADIGSGTSASATANAVEVESSGRIVVGGFATGASSWLIAGFTSAGALDTTFSPDAGDQGYEQFVPPGSVPAAPSSVNDIAEQSDGKLVMVGVGLFTPGFFNEAIVGRFSATGVPDTTFDADGFRNSGLGTTTNGAGAEAVAIQPDGKILAVVSHFFPGSAATDFKVLRLSGADGSPDTSFSAPDGIAEVDLGNFDLPRDLALAPSGRLYVVGSSDPLPSGGSDLALGVGALVATPPPAPQALTLTPAGPANDNSPELKGTTVIGTTVELFANGTCTGTPLATGVSKQDFEGPGVTVTVADNSTTSYSARAVASGGTSVCSTAATYVESTPSQGGPPETGGPPIVPPLTPPKKCKKGQKLKKEKCVKKKRKKKR